MLLREFKFEIFEFCRSQDFMELCVYTQGVFNLIAAEYPWRPDMLNQWFMELNEPIGYAGVAPACPHNSSSSDVLFRACLYWQRFLGSTPSITEEGSVCVRNVGVAPEFRSSRDEISFVDGIPAVCGPF